MRLFHGSQFQNTLMHALGEAEEEEEEEEEEEIQTPIRI